MSLREAFSPICTEEYSVNLDGLTMDGIAKVAVGKRLRALSLLDLTSVSVTLCIAAVVVPQQVSIVFIFLNVFYFLNVFLNVFSTRYSVVIVSRNAMNGQFVSINY